MKRSRELIPAPFGVIQHTHQTPTTKDLTPLRTRTLTAVGYRQRQGKYIVHALCSMWGSCFALVDAPAKYWNKNSSRCLVPARRFTQLDSSAFLPIPGSPTRTFQTQMPTGYLYGLGEVPKAFC